MSWRCKRDLTTGLLTCPPQALKMLINMTAADYSFVEAWGEWLMGVTMTISRQPSHLRIHSKQNLQLNWKHPFHRSNHQWSSVLNNISLLSPPIKCPSPCLGIEETQRLEQLLMPSVEANGFWSTERAQLLLCHEHHGIKEVGDENSYEWDWGLSQSVGMIGFIALGW